jgi:hypothetical protein
MILGFYSLSGSHEKSRKTSKIFSGFMLKKKSENSSLMFLKPFGYSFHRIRNPKKRTNAAMLKSSTI